jgi:AcrR family transcriptional regulator
MARTGGERTRSRILAAAEKLFSRDGFDATTVDGIARAAGVNKALIYYHFESKDDLLLKLFESIIAEVEAHAEEAGAAAGGDPAEVLRRELRSEIEFLAARRPIVTLMLAEALRSNPRERFLFRCAELVMRPEHSGGRSRPGQREQVDKFFTRFIPMVMFVALRDKWLEHFEGDPARIVDDFVDAFARSHQDSGDRER